MVLNLPRRIYSRSTRKYGMLENLGWRVGGNLTTCTMLIQGRSCFTGWIKNKQVLTNNLSQKTADEKLLAVDNLLQGDDLPLISALCERRVEVCARFPPFSHHFLFSIRFCPNKIYNNSAGGGWRLLRTYCCTVGTHGAIDAHGIYPFLEV